ncbi:MAG: DUF1565 domain-containing protein [Leptolyngbyaceae cyanobacterium RU_5_1]|nr:DUF1565 domain-containing protein [Leptolyngbyaceae cyanobacterium RU_5_1]
MTGLRVAISLSLGLLSGVSAILLEDGCAKAQTDPATQLASVVQSAGNQVAASVLYVDPIHGNNGTADGSDRAPFKTITHALQVAQPNTVILLASGTYSAETGESFPIALQPRITIKGNAELVERR